MNNTSEWKNKIHPNANKNLFYTLINDNNIAKKQIEDYWIYLIKRKLIILDSGIIIDGNIYVVNCKIKLQENVQITNQTFVTQKAIINQQELKQLIVSIQWNMKIHYHIPVLLQDLEDKKKQCLQENLFDNALIYAQQHLQICIDNFGSNHSFVADSYTFLGIICEEWDKKIECYNKALKISLHNFGINHPWIANICNRFGNGYDKNKQDELDITFF
ncbi:hypothetical protein RFI_38507 [Reticulomyxa filosa]|uniref:Tetratricopeptide repeat protein n=1 Tax=Reticulomyxa filosa TaxID=46433 RepID=X6LCB4_RETFI|nr:hypothetical protein RFI_38507 [Reticulomyxa filosa]|eukprot:ETN98980.1 hypothetical protein RFI_38507 [Reticulomyxa filosa]